MSCQQDRARVARGSDVHDGALALKLTTAVVYGDVNNALCAQGPSAKSADFNARLSWSSFAMSFFDATTVSLQYTSLQRDVTYAAYVVFNANGEPLASAHAADAGSHTRVRSNQNLMRLVVDGNATVWRAFPCCH